MKTDEIFWAIQHHFKGAYPMHRTIQQAVDKMPEAAQGLAGRIQWYSVGSNFRGLADVVGGQPVILLSDYIGDEDAPSTVAHELAHHLCGHVEQAAATVQDLIKRESEAANLAASWGFVGPGADVGRCVADALSAAHLAGASMPENYTGPSLGMYADWAIGWSVHQARLWERLEDTFTENQRDLMRRYRESGSQAAICTTWAAGLGGQMPKEPPKLK